MYSLSKHILYSQLSPSFLCNYINMLGPRQVRCTELIIITVSHWPFTENHCTCMTVHTATWSDKMTGTVQMQYFSSRLNTFKVECCSEYSHHKPRSWYDLSTCVGGCHIMMMCPSTWWCRGGPTTVRLSFLKQHSLVKQNIIMLIQQKQ